MKLPGFMQRIGDENGMPLIWERNYGKGKFVLDNFGLTESSTRVLCGFLQSSTDAGVHPVINGSVFYLMIFRLRTDAVMERDDYNTSIAEFYLQCLRLDMSDACSETR